MAVKRTEIVFNQGSTYDAYIDVLDFNKEPIDLTGYQAKSSMKRHYSSTSSYDFTVQIHQDSGVIQISMPRDDSALVPVGRYQFDLVIWDDTTTTTLLSGLVEVEERITDVTA